jgi:predicted transcriptional regulator
MREALEEKGWIAQTNRNRGYEITPCGRLVSDEVSSSLEAATISQKLRDIQRYFLTNEFDFGLERLGDARITRPTPSNTIAPLNRLGELFASADERLWAFVSAFDTVAAQAAHEVYMESDGTSDAILTSAAFETVLDNPGMADICAEMSEAGAALYRYESEDPLYSLNVCNDTAVLELNDGKGGVPAVIESDDEAILAWAEETFERYKRESELLDTEAFTN